LVSLTVCRSGGGGRIHGNVCGTGINKDSDGALVAATKRGDTQAFEEWFFVTSKGLAVARRITNNREDAEDVAQESFHKASYISTTFKKSRGSLLG